MKKRNKQRGMELWHSQSKQWDLIQKIISKWTAKVFEKNEYHAAVCNITHLVPKSRQLPIKNTNYSVLKWEIVRLLISIICQSNLIKWESTKRGTLGFGIHSHYVRHNHQNSAVSCEPKSSIGRELFPWTGEARHEANLKLC